MTVEPLPRPQSTPHLRLRLWVRLLRAARPIEAELRRRGAFDFPVLSAAVSLRSGRDGTVEEGRIVLGAVSSAPLDVSAAIDAIRGRKLEDDAIAECAELAAAAARPMDNTDYSLHWRKRAVRAFVAYALRELRGDDVRELRLRVGRLGLQGPEPKA